MLFSTFNRSGGVLGLHELLVEELLFFCCSDIVIVTGIWEWLWCNAGLSAKDLPVLFDFCSFSVCAADLVCATGFWWYVALFASGC